MQLMTADLNAAIRSVFILPCAYCLPRRRTREGFSCCLSFEAYRSPQTDTERNEQQRKDHIV